MKLLFVYNANSGTLNALFDAGHKLFSAKTYPCSLCALTYDTFSENKQWKAFRESATVEIEFYHIDEFEKAFPETSFEYPIILEERNNDLIPVLKKEALNKFESVEELINAIEKILTSSQPQGCSSSE